MVTQEYQLPAATSATVAGHGRGAVPIPTGGPSGTIRQRVGQFMWNRRGLSKMRCQRAKGLYLGFKHWVGGGRELGLTRDWLSATPGLCILPSSTDGIPVKPFFRGQSWNGRMRRRAHDSKSQDKLIETKTNDDATPHKHAPASAIAPSQRLLHPVAFTCSEEAPDADKLLVKM